MMKGKHFIRLFQCMIAALVVATAFASYYSRYYSASDWMVVKESSVVACGNRVWVSSNSLFDKESIQPEHVKSSAKKTKNERRPTNKDNGNSCPHQQGVSSLCTISGTRNRLLKILSC